MDESYDNRTGRCASEFSLRALEPKDRARSGYSARLQCCVDRRAGEQARGIERRQRTIVRAHEQRDLRATEDHAIAAARPHAVDDLVIAKPGCLADYAVDEFLEDDVVHDFLFPFGGRAYFNGVLLEHLRI